MKVTNFIPVFIELRSLNILENRELNIYNQMDLDWKENILTIV